MTRKWTQWPLVARGWEWWGVLCGAHAPPGSYSIGGVELRHVVHDKAVADFAPFLISIVFHRCFERRGDALRLAGIG